MTSVAKAGNAGATVLVVETVLPEGGEPHYAQMLDVAMLAITGGRERTAGRYRALLDVEDRLARDTIEREQQAGLVDDDDGGNRLSIPDQIDEKRRRLRVVIPDVVVHDLEVPEILAGVRIHCDH